jgi:D-sedoheptulose 7-phosphate isomerase
VTTIASYLKNVTKIVSSLDKRAYDSVLSEIKRAAQQRHTIYLVGNGASSITVSHFANDLMKNSGENISNLLGLGIRVIALSDNMPFFTAVSNDISTDMAYVEYLKACALSGDLLIIFSSGIPHRNLVEGAKFSFKKGLRVVSVTGELPKGLKEYSHVLCSVKGESTEEIDSAHTFLCHSWAVQLKKELKMSVVFLDRDGVINRNRADYIKSWDEFVFLPGVEEAIRKLNEKGYAIVVVTNQAVVGHKIIRLEVLNDIHARMDSALYSQGAMISKIYYCPHVPADNCKCRKPRNGMIEQAFKELPLDREKGIMIGDSYTDIEAGQKSGLTTILLSGDRVVSESRNVVPDYYALDLPEAADLILSKNFKHNTERFEEQSSLLCSIQ